MGEASDLPAPRTRAEADRARRDVVTGLPAPEARLIRFVAGPDGVVTPDLSRSLPGRGVWTAADRASVETAARKNLFSRSAKTRLSAPADLADQVERLLMRRLLDGLGLARRAGVLISGYEKVAAALASGKAAWLIEALDGADDGRRKMLQERRRAAAARGAPPARLAGLFTAEEMGLALGLDNVIHLALLAGRGSERWTVDIDRLSGFRPLVPSDWANSGREEP